MQWPRVARRPHGPRPKRLLVGVASVVVAVTVVLGAITILLARQGDGLLEVSGSLSLIADSQVRVGEVFDFGVPTGNASSDVTLVMRSVALPHGLPAHLQLIHQALTYQGVLGDHGWPVGSLDGRHVVTSPLDGARVAPGAQPIVVLAFVADQPGVYVVGPVLVRAEVPGPFGIGSRKAEQTYRQYAVICIEQSQHACDDARQQVIATG